MVGSRDIKFTVSILLHSALVSSTLVSFLGSFPPHSGSQWIPVYSLPDQLLHREVLLPYRPTQSPLIASP